MPIRSDVAETGLHDDELVKEEVHFLHEDRSHRLYTSFRYAISKLLNDRKV
jgi:hypothetical protein